MPSRLPIKPTKAAKMITTTGGAKPRAPSPAASITPQTQNATIAPLNPRRSTKTLPVTPLRIQQLRNVVPSHSNVAYRVLSEAYSNDGLTIVAAGAHIRKAAGE